MIRKMMFVLILALLTSVAFVACSETEPNAEPSVNAKIEALEGRPFLMGFTTWTYGPEASDIEDTYSFVLNNGDIYSEQFDHYIPWSAWMNDLPLPAEFVNNVAYRLSKRPIGKKMLLSVSLLNIGRDDLLEDANGSLPAYDSINDPKIKTAYIKHLKYLIDRFAPNYLIFAMEVNELRVKDEAKWMDYKKLAGDLRTELKSLYPNLPVSESVTLHNWYNPYQTHSQAYVDEITAYVNQMDFAAISFYPFLLALKSKEEIQGAFDFLHHSVNRPIAFSETASNAEPIDIPAFAFYADGDADSQRNYLEALALNGASNNYLFFIWWCHRDYDKMWVTLPDDLKDIALLWRDTGVLDDAGNTRKAYTTWTILRSKPVK